MKFKGKLTILNVATDVMGTSHLIVSSKKSLFILEGNDLKYLIFCYMDNGKPIYLKCKWAGYATAQHSLYKIKKKILKS